MLLSRRPFIAVRWLLVSLLGVAGLHLLLGDFLLASAQLLLAFGLPLLATLTLLVTRGVIQGRRPALRAPFAAGALALLLFAGLTYLILQVPWPTVPSPAPADLLVAPVLSCLPLLAAVPLGIALVVGLRQLLRERST